MTVTNTQPGTAADDGGKPSNMRSLSRAMEVFAELQRADRPQRLSDLARNCGMSLPTTLRILRVLQDFGMVSQTDKTYRIGPAVLPAARSYIENDPLVTASRPVLQQVAAQTGMTASLYTRLGIERILVVRVDGDAPLRYDMPLGKRLPLTVGAAGKVLLASASDEHLQKVVQAAVAAGHEEPHLQPGRAQGPLARAGNGLCLLGRRARHRSALSGNGDQQVRAAQRIRRPDQPGGSCHREGAQGRGARTSPRCSPAR
jgi:DNA-binding IclR family transcriptional regulator